MKHYALVALFLLILACESSTDIIYQPTDLTLTIQDDRGIVIKGAQVVIFDNEEDFIEFRNTGDLTNQNPVLTDDQGQVVYTNLSEQLNYYFFATYRDRERFVDLENYNKAYAYPGFLIKGSKTRATIKLEQADNIVVFFSLNQNASQLPIDIFLEGDSVGRINQTLEQQPTSPNVGGTISFRLRNGITNWYSKSKLGCLWSGQLALGSEDNFTLQEFGTCESGAVTFWTDGDNDGEGILPIQIRLNDKDDFGSLSKSGTTPGLCFGSQGLSGSRETGSYNYYATSANGLCTWTGSLQVIKGECTLIKLEKCN